MSTTTDKFRRAARKAPERRVEDAGRTVRLTVDLSVSQHRALKMFVAQEGVAATEVMRSLLGLLQGDSEVRGRVLAELHSD